MKQAFEEQKFIRSIFRNAIIQLGMDPQPTNTIILQNNKRFGSIYRPVGAYGCNVVRNNPTIAKWTLRPDGVNGVVSLVSYLEKIGQFGDTSKTSLGTKLGYDILNELMCMDESETEIVFFHGYIRYDSFILDNDKLTGLRSRNYGGFFQIGFDKIVGKYIDMI
ncbi:hypothetical protein BB560_005564 [Smittium megazygosporum]|uniref:Uncharacterized protein n=1 Tax=Smittium megazygosporum TaxID=133381 RepID=A0A2T9Z3D4_9FUNG|nr:hypothetical protein BB560_005564 [Smittium megazygosporum]